MYYMDKWIIKIKNKTQKIGKLNLFALDDVAAFSVPGIGESLAGVAPANTTTPQSYLPIQAGLEGNIRYIL